MPERKGDTVVSDSELSKAAKAIGCTPKEILTQAPIRLYKCEKGETSWTFTGVYGILSVIADMTAGIVTLKLVDLDTQKVSFEQECYQGFTFQKLDDFFFCFESDEFMVGLCFAEDFDAQRFCFKVSGLIKHTSSIPVKKRSVPPPKRVEKKKKAEKKGWFSGWFSKKKQPPRRPVRLKISGPKNFEHVTHIGYKSSEGFTGKIPDKWKKIFDKAGVTEEQLKDKKTAKFIMKTIVNAPPPPPLEDMGTKKVKKINISSSGGSSGGGSSSGPKKSPRNLPKPQGGRGDLLAAIRKGKSLKKAQIPEVNEMTEHEQNNIANTISRALALRREAVEDSDDEEEEEDDDWEC